MPTYVRTDKCRGCMECVRICPSDIMHIEPANGQAVNIEPTMCWECFACVKSCPENAVEIRGYVDFAPMNHRVVPQRTLNRILWRIESRGGEVREFAFPTRTNSWGSIVPPQSTLAPDPAALDGPELAFEPMYLAVDSVPSPQPPTTPPDH